MTVNRVIRCYFIFTLFIEVRNQVCTTINKSEGLKVVTYSALSNEDRNKSKLVIKTMKESLPFTHAVTQCCDGFIKKNKNLEPSNENCVRKNGYCSKENNCKPHCYPPCGNGICTSQCVPTCQNSDETCVDPNSSLNNIMTVVNNPVTEALPEQPNIKPQLKIVFENGTTINKTKKIIPNIKEINDNREYAMRLSIFIVTTIIMVALIILIIWELRRN